MAESTNRPPTKSAPGPLNKFKANEIFTAITAAGLDPREFDIEDSETEARIKRRWSESYFIVGGAPGHYVGHYVAENWGVDWPYDVSNWEAVMQRVRNWLADVKLDLETPDLWAELRNEPELLGPAFDDAAENTPFTKDEQKEVARRLQELAEYARHTNRLSAAQMQVLNAKLDYLVSAAGRLGRIDWRNAFVGAILGYAIAVALPLESTRLMLLTVLRGVVHLYGLPALPGG